LRETVCKGIAEIDADGDEQRADDAPMMEKRMLAP